MSSRVCSISQGCVTANEITPTSSVNNSLCGAVRPTIHGSLGFEGLDVAIRDIGLNVKCGAGQLSPFSEFSGVSARATDCAATYAPEALEVAYRECGKYRDRRRSAAVVRAMRAASLHNPPFQASTSRGTGEQ